MPKSPTSPRQSKRKADEISKVEPVATDAAPEAIGPYNQATSAGGMMFVSGCIGFVPGTSPPKLIDGDITVQTRQVLENMKAVIEAGGATMANVAKTTVLIANDLREFAAVNKVYAEFFPNKPARACYAVAALPAGALIEIEAVVAL